MRSWVGTHSQPAGPAPGTGPTRTRSRSLRPSLPVWSSPCRTDVLGVPNHRFCVAHPCPSHRPSPPSDTPSPLSFRRLRDAPSLPAPCFGAVPHPLYTTTRSPRPFRPVNQWEYAGWHRRDRLTNRNEWDRPATNFWPMGALAGVKGVWTRLS